MIFPSEFLKRHIKLLRHPVLPSLSVSRPLNVLYIEADVAERHGNRARCVLKLGSVTMFALGHSFRLKLTNRDQTTDLLWITDVELFPFALANLVPRNR